MSGSLSLSISFIHFFSRGDFFSYNITDFQGQTARSKRFLPNEIATAAHLRPARGELDADRGYGR